jgi:hypothetical protein
MEIGESANATAQNFPAGEWRHPMRRNRLWFLLIGLCALCVLVSATLTRTLRDQWIEVPRDAFSAARVVHLLDQNSVDFEVEHQLGVTYVRLPKADWPTVCALLERGSIENDYPLNIKRKTMFGQIRDVVRHP